MQDEIAKLERRRDELAASRGKLLEALADLPPGHPHVSDVLARIDRINEELRRIDGYLILLKAQERAGQRMHALSEMAAGAAFAKSDAPKALAAIAEADRVLSAAPSPPPEWDW